MAGERIRVHGEVDEPRVWDFIRHARLGLALAAGPDEFDNDSSKVYAYLRGGLPVVVEHRVLQGELVMEHGMGAVCSFDDSADLVERILEQIRRPAPVNRAAVMEVMARDFSWDRRAETYAALFRQLVGPSPSEGGAG